MAARRPAPPPPTKRTSWVVTSIRTNPGPVWAAGKREPAAAKQEAMYFLREEKSREGNCRGCESPIAKLIKKPCRWPVGIHDNFRVADNTLGRPFGLPCRSLVGCLDSCLHLTFPHGRPHRDVSFRRRCSLSFIISLKSITGRISIGPSPYLKPGCCETS